MRSLELWLLTLTVIILAILIDNFLQTSLIVARHHFEIPIGSMERAGSEQKRGKDGMDPEIEPQKIGGRHNGNNEESVTQHVDDDGDHPCSAFRSGRVPATDFGSLFAFHHCVAEEGVVLVPWAAEPSSGEEHEPKGVEDPPHEIEGHSWVPDIP